jgi:formylglycine-generating enzyme required for sulfatase activity
MEGDLRIDWVDIPAGQFRMGSDMRIEASPPENEMPQHHLHLPEFRITRVPVSNAAYQVFVAATHHPPPGHWIDGRIPEGKAHHPVTFVDWSDALAFCRWARVRLPTEAEWEKAARGDDGRLWPWGNQLPDATRCNFNNNLGDTSVGGQYLRGASPHGVLDMAGNVWEWTSSAYQRYPYQPKDGREDLGFDNPRVVRGGSYNHSDWNVRCADRQWFSPTARDVYIGFRVAESGDAESRLPMDWATIPDGDFLMGSCAREYPLRSPVDELPQHTVHVPGFRISRTLITNLQYKEFVEATGHRTPGHWVNNAIPPEQENHPVTYVDWDDCTSFCAWAGVRMPTEAEWEKAARGTDGRLYPWGNQEPDQLLCNYRHNIRTVTTTPVEAHAVGASPYGVLDLAGNVWEWVSSLHRPYPYRMDDGREDQASREQRALRGGSFYSSAEHLRCAFRSKSYPTRRRDHIGFRVVTTGG